MTEEDWAIFGTICVAALIVVMMLIIGSNHR